MDAQRDHSRHLGVLTPESGVRRVQVAPCEAGSRFELVNRTGRLVLLHGVEGVVLEGAVLLPHGRQAWIVMLRPDLAFATVK